jgi:alpha-tubulin suppressor-like RCC1 family protein
MGQTGASAATANVTAANFHGITLSALGSACGVGQNEYGELGDGTNKINRNTLVPVATMVGALSAISTGYYHSVALKTDGTVWTWGYNGDGELGSGNNINRPTPFSVVGLTNVVSVAAGNYHTLAVKSDGTVWAWGDNQYGELGDGTMVGKTTPVQVNQLTNVVAVAAGQNYFSLALKSDGTVWAWGYNGDGELGDGTNLTRTSPMQVANLSGVSQIAAGKYHSLARKSDGTVWAWGDGANGQLGNGATASQSNIVRAGSIASATSIAAGDYHSLAVQSDGSVWAWGYNAYGQLGDNTTSNETVPEQIGATISGFSGFSAVAAGSRFSLALQANGTTWAWGDNTQGELGNGGTNQSLTPLAQSPCPPPPVGGLGVSAFTGHVSASVANEFTLFAKSDGTVWGSGNNTYGQLGDGTQINQSSPVQAVNITGASSAAAGEYHSLAVTSAGSVWSWGYNAYGELGNGQTTNQSVPAAISGFTGAVAVAAGPYHSVVLKSDGTVWSFGYNDYGQLGNGTANNSSSPVQVTGLTGVTAIAAGGQNGYAFTLALRSDGTVWSWGYNGDGELGDGTTATRQSPVPVAGLTNVTAIAAGSYHSFALRSDGTVWAWGYDGQGQLGDGGSAAESNIVRVNGLTNVIAIAAGERHGIAVRIDGTVWVWGLNTSGQLGNGNTNNSSVPIQVVGLTGALAVAGGSDYTVALTSNGSVSAWGSNDGGQFGVALPASSTVAVASVTGIIAVNQLTTSIAPATGGTIVISPVSPAGFYGTGSTVCLIAEPASGNIFTGWSGTQLNAAGCLTMTSDASVAAGFTAWIPPAALSFVPVAPCRVVDTRNPAGPLGAPSLVAGATRSFTIPGACGIPAQAQAFSLNLTVVPQGTLGYVTIWPSGQSRPLASTLNALDGRIKSNAAIVPAGTGGAVSLYATNNTDAILDINGYFVPAIDSSALAFYPLTPCRVADTRNAAGSLGGPYLIGGQTRSFPIQSSACGIPVGALAYSLNFTALPHTTLGYLSVWPTGQGQPLVSTLNAPTGAITANAAIVPAGTAGAVDLYVTDDADMILDINGYFAAAGAGGYSLYNLTPCRIEDTRNPAGTPPFAGTIAVTATGVPCGVPPEAQALVTNATVVPSGELGYLTLWPDGGSQPVVSTLNSLDASITSNMALVPTTNGFIDAYAAGPAPTYLILDISGFFAPAGQ